MSLVADLAVMAAASILLLGGSSKAVNPHPIAVTLAMLWNTVTGQDREAVPPRLGRLLGFVEVALAVAIVLHRSRPTSAALVLFALGLSASGVIGVMSGGRLPCACFGKSGRVLGYWHILQFPLWMAAAWCVTRDPWLFDTGTRLEQNLVMLAACAGLTTAGHLAVMWRAVHPLARARRRAGRSDASEAGGAGRSAW